MRYDAGYYLLHAHAPFADCRPHGTGYAGIVRDLPQKFPNRSGCGHPGTGAGDRHPALEIPGTAP